MAATVPEYSICEFVNEMPAELSWKLPSNPDQPCVFWSLDVDQTSSSSSSSGTGERIKSALCNLELERRCVLIQFWAPLTEFGGRTYLATLDQPFALMEITRKLCDYRKHMLNYKFGVTEERNEGLIGPLGRVFCNKLPESTPDVRYYSTKEYPQRDFAIDCGIQEAYFLPVFEFYGGRCVGVLEYVYTEGDFAFPCIIDELNDALEVQNLTLKHLLDSQKKETIHGWRRATDELDEILDKVHKTYNLPLAQTWIPYRHGDLENICTKLAQYVDDSNGLSISNAYDIHQLTKGNVLIDKTLLSHQPCFCEDISKLSITEYPLVHYARDDELTSCFYMCLQSTHTGSHDYVLELFLPHDKTNRGDAQTLLDSILKTMKQEFQSFKVSSGEQLGEELSVQVIRSSAIDKLDAFNICQTTGSPPRPEVIQNEIEVMQLDSSIVHRQTFPSTEPSVQLDLTFPPLKLGPAKFPLQENELIHFEHFGPKKVSETEQNQVEYVEVDGSPAMHNGMDRVRTDQSNTTITYKKRRPKKAPVRKKRTPELTIGHEVGWKLEEDDADSFSASQSSEKSNCVEHEIVSQTSPRTKKVKRSCSPTNLKQQNDFVKGGVKITTESSAKEAPPVDPTLKQTIVVATHIIPDTAPLPDSRTVTVKATYTENIIIKFQLSISAGVSDLEEKVIKRLKLKEGSFRCKYKDSNGDYISIACDEDLQTCIGSLSTLDKNILRLMIIPQTCVTI